MIWLKALIYGLIQGLTEFFPISSSGHLALLHQLIPLEAPDALFFDVCLHVGTLAAVIWYFRKDVMKLILSVVRIVRDLFYNLGVYIRSEGGGDPSAYRRILSGNYRYLAAMIFIASIPTAILGAVLEGLIRRANETLLIPGMGLLFTGIVLIVVDKVDQGNKPPREVPLRRAVPIGVAQGVSVIPGLSRAGMTICSSLICGMNRSVAVRFSFLLAIPTMIGALAFEIGADTGRGLLHITDLGVGAVGASAAFFTGMLAIRKTLELVRKRQLKYFAYYCFAAGVLAMIGYFAIGGHN